MKNRWKWIKFLLLLMVVYGLAYSTLSGIGIWSSAEEEMDLQTDSYIELAPGQVLEQEIKIAKDKLLRLKTFGIAVGRNGTEKTNGIDGNYIPERSGFLRVGIEQKGNLVQEKPVAFGELQEEIYFEIPVELEEFDEGTAKIRIEYVGFNEMDRVRVLAGMDQLNVKPALLDGEELELSCALKLSWDVAELKGIFRTLRWVMLLFLPVGLGVSLYLLLFTNRSKLTLVLLGLSLFCLCALRYYELILDCQPFAEDLNVFYASAKNLSFIKNLFVKDAGYLAFLQHLITWLYFKVFHFGTKTVFAMNLTALCFIAGMCLLPVSRVSKAFFPKEVSFLLAVAIPTILVKQYESFVFINFIYFGILYFLTMAAQDFHDLPLGKYVAHLVFSVTIILSKGFYVALLPMGLAGFIYCLKKDKKKAGWCFALLAGTLIQFIAYFFSGEASVATESGVLFSVSVLAGTAFHFIQGIGKILLGILIPFITFPARVAFGFGIFYLFVVAAGLIHMVKRGKNLFLFAGIQLILLSSVGVSILSLPFLYEQNELAFSRQEFFMIMALIYGVGVFYREFQIRAEKWKKKLVIGYFLLIGVFMIGRNVLEEDKLTIKSPNTPAFSLKASETAGDFTVYGPYTLKQAFYIPNTPSYWCYMENVDISLYSSPREMSFGRANQTYQVEYAQETLAQKEYREFNLEELGWNGDGLFGIWVSKSSLQEEYRVECLDRSGQILGCCSQLEDRRKRMVGFSFDMPLNGVAKIRFIDQKTGETVSVYPEVILIYDKERE